MIPSNEANVIEYARNFTPSELLATICCRQLAGTRRVFAGIGLPTLAVAMAQQSTSPDIEQIFESGICGAHPPKLPETVAESSLATGAEAILSMATLASELTIIHLPTDEELTLLRTAVDPKRVYLR